VTGMAVYSSLVTFWPYNLSLSLRHYMFEDTAGGGWLAYRNSVSMAIGTALIGSMVIFTGACSASSPWRCRAWCWAWVTSSSST